jgi:hypothetical protein
MRLNVTNCKVMHIKDSTNAPLPNITFGGNQLEVVEKYKYLGIEINSKLDLTDQWQRIRQRIGPVTYLLKQLKLDGFKEEILMTVLKSHIMLHFN